MSLDHDLNEDKSDQNSSGLKTIGMTFHVIDGTPFFLAVQNETITDEFSAYVD